MTHDVLVTRARGGDRSALDALLREMKDMVLGDPIAAEDATQEILIRLVTGLDSFRGESSFRTWVYRVASNHLLTTRKQRASEPTDTFDEMETRLATGTASETPAADDQLVVVEAKLICSSHMLMSLDGDHRLAYILGEILELPSEEAAAVMEISDDAYRKRLSRARTRMTEFMGKQCGIVEPANPCRCAKIAGFAVSAGFIDPKQLVWATDRMREAKQVLLDEVSTMQRAVAVFRSTSFAASDTLVDGLRELIERDPGGVLS